MGQARSFGMMEGRGARGGPAEIGGFVGISGWFAGEGIEKVYMYRVEYGG